MTERPDPAPLCEYDPDPETPVSVAVLEAVAAARGLDSTELLPTYGYTLFDRVDPGALDSLVADRDAVDFAVEFELYGSRVRIEGANRILVYEAD
ncbi:HalOD1 output domain-containing protein [Salinilacihabitans rarus]|uniref:HalOD1 output domain-containing protein n=1 Tax=Salinilacihabitans rarus TaxID=2961596 RepID=UPI0020C90A74|nr:HalOD1 output domain-containing protein [Salinilacihabitans rarus]